jgi:hypothetical protein
MLKTYAFYDVVGVKDALKAGNGLALLKEFWQTADAWTNGPGNSFGQQAVQDGDHSEEPRVYVVTFSDSALLFTRPEFKLDIFYKIAGNLKQKLQTAVGGVYCIISRGDEIAHPALPARGGTVMDDQNRPAYLSIAGSGEAWVNLHLADRAIGRRKDWHKKFSLYAVGAQSVPGGGAGLEQETFKTIDGGDEIVCALG